MGLLSAILREVDNNTLVFFCPGCNEMHQVWVKEGPEPRWTWNENVNKPTFTPSLLITGTVPMTQEEQNNWFTNKVLPVPVPFVCHSFITDGRIEFLSDCTHSLANQTVDIPPLKDRYV